MHCCTVDCSNLGNDWNTPHHVIRRNYLIGKLSLIFSTTAPSSDDLVYTRRILLADRRTANDVIMTRPSERLTVRRGATPSSKQCVTSVGRWQNSLTLVVCAHCRVLRNGSCRKHCDCWRKYLTGDNLDVKIAIFHGFLGLINLFARRDPVEVHDVLTNGVDMTVSYNGSW